MNPLETPSTPKTYAGHVKNGVVVLDTTVPLTEGQAVRVETLAQEATLSVCAERAEQVQRMQNLFTQWDEEDSRLSDEEADRLRIALQQNRGLALRTPNLE